MNITYLTTRCSGSTLTSTVRQRTRVSSSKMHRHCFDSLCIHGELDRLTDEGVLSVQCAVSVIDRNM